MDTSCRTSAEQQTVLNSCRLLTRLIPYIFEDPDWRSFFWSKPEPDQIPLGKLLMLAISDLLYCPEFTVSSAANRSRDEVTMIKILIRFNFHRQGWRTGEPWQLRIYLGERSWFCTNTVPVTPTPPQQSGAAAPNTNLLFRVNIPSSHQWSP